MRLFSVILLCLFSITLIGQNRNYLSNRYNDRQTQKGHIDPAFRGKINKLVNSIENPADWPTITVPIVFHVLYAKGEDSIPQHVLLNQLTLLNEDFAGLTTPISTDERDVSGHFNALKVDTRINFCVPADGALPDYVAPVTYRRVDSLFNGGLNKMKREAFGTKPVNPNKCLNIWVTPLKNNQAGFAQYPSGKSGKDGIVISPKYLATPNNVGTKYGLGKTLTHLVGTYLGLTPVWGEANCSDDWIEDTPVHNAPNFGQSQMGHISLCDGNPLEMTMNFMDANDDAYVHMFTVGQARWMRAVLHQEGLRPKHNRVLTECNFTYLTSKSLVATKVDQLAKRLTTFSTLPNPTSESFVVALDKRDLDAMHTITVHDLKGGIVKKVKFNGNDTRRVTIAVNEWPRGLYIVRAVLISGEVKTKKITVQ